MTIDRMRIDFEEYATGGNFSRLRADLQRSAATVPFGRADGLGGAINGILARLQRDIASGAPLPIARAYQDVVATLRADVEARIDDGSLVVVR
jgi:hypothetical protein